MPRKGPGKSCDTVALKDWLTGGRDVAGATADCAALEEAPTEAPFAAAEVAGAGARTACAWLRAAIA